MSELSPGSKATTNVFMVLGALALVTLVVVQNMSTAPREPVDCSDRIISLTPPPELSGGESPTSVIFVLSAAGEVSDIQVRGNQPELVSTIVTMLTSARFTPAADGSDVLCEYTFG